MTTLLPPPPAPPSAERPAAAAPARHGPRAWTIVVVTLAALLVAALLNPDDLLRRAQQQPFGWQRTVTVRLAEINHTVSAALWLDRPRRGLDRLFGHEHPDASPLPAPLPTTPGGSPGPTASPTSQPTQSQQPQRPTAANPLRVYLGGDSVAQAFGDAFSRAAQATKVIAPKIEYRYSTGLTRPDYFDWPGRLRAELATKPPPQVIIVLFGANDVQPIMTPSGPARTGSTTWLTEYRRRVAATMDLLSASGVDVYWVGQPLMRSSYFSERIGELDDIYSAEAARHPGITFVDSRPVLADAQGHYSAYLPGSDGRPVLMRTPDGVHLTAAGGDRLAAAVLKVIGRTWPLPG
jgi:hypothetical protein